MQVVPVIILELINKSAAEALGVMMARWSQCVLSMVCVCHSRSLILQALSVEILPEWHSLAVPSEYAIFSHLTVHSTLVRAFYL